MQNQALMIFQCFKNTKKLPIFDWYRDFLESPLDKLQICTTLGWSLALVHLSGSGPWTQVNTLARVHNNSADPQGKTNALCCLTLLNYI